MRSLPFAERKSKMYKYETHCHTSEASGCGMSTGAEMAQKYKDEGYDGIFITDHFFNGNSAFRETSRGKNASGFTARAMKMPRRTATG